MGKIIGIDLGTTNSVVAVMEGDQPTVIVNEEGNRTTPSVVGFGKDGERLVGSVAKRQAITNPEKTVSSIKRYMGQKFDECGAESKHSTYQVVRGDNGQPRVKIDDKLYSPPEISAMVLQKLKREAERYLGQEVTEAVITVPASSMMRSASQPRTQERSPDWTSSGSSTSRLLQPLPMVWTRMKTRSSRSMTLVAVPSTSQSSRSATRSSR